MIRWLVQSLDAHASLAHGAAPPGLLGPDEEAQLAGFRVNKRRQDWLLGRWTAKHLLQMVLAEQIGSMVPLRTLVIGNDPDGAPFATLTAKVPAVAVASGRIPLSLSISHSHGLALCAMYNGNEVEGRIGADIEQVAARDWHFIEQFFTDQEMAAVRAAPPDQQAILVTLVWSGKEAILKSLRVGLRVDTRRVACLPGAPLQMTTTWAPLALTMDNELSGSTAWHWSGWWQLLDSSAQHVMTLVVGQNAAEAQL